MAKKSKSYSEKHPLLKYLADAISFTATTVEKGAVEAMRDSKQFADVKEALRRRTTVIALCTVALAIGLFGLGNLVEYLLPSIPKGVTHMVLALITCLAALAYRQGN